MRIPRALVVLVLGGTAIATALPKQPAPEKAPAPIVPPQVSLVISADTADAGWRMQLKNDGAVPLRVVADARLLTLEIKGEAGAPVRCALPADARPASDVERALLLPPGRSYSERFDPLLYCFGAKESASLAPGALVTATYGWSAPKAGASAPPFVVSPPDMDPASRDALAWPSPTKEIVSLELTLPARTTSAAPAAPVEGAPRLRVATAQRIDTGSAFDASVTITVTNEGSRPETLLLVPATVALDVSTPDGRALRCSLGVAPTAPKDLLTTIGPSRSASITVAADRMCPSRTFDAEGLYRVVPVLDTRRVASPTTSQTTLATGAWSGEPTSLRVRQGKTSRPRPELDPQK